jgi:hypothetical protein
LTHSLKGAWFQSLKLRSNFLASTFAFKFTGHRYSVGLGPAPPPTPGAPPPRGTLNLNPAVEQFQMMVTSWVNRADGRVWHFPPRDVIIFASKHGPIN